MRALAFGRTPRYAFAVAALLLISAWQVASAETAAKSTAKVTDPFETIKVDNDPFETTLSDTPVDASAYVPPKARWNARQTNFDATLPSPPQSVTTGPVTPAPVVTKDPCAAAVFKPLSQLGISIAQPTGESPTDPAAACWNQINAGPNSACRYWSVFSYQWDATCLAYHPLYFEEVNAERYGYVCGCRYCCGDCVLQPACSAAHFFGTVPALPYCMLTDCPTEWVYTLGYYRPGDCVPWRNNYPPCDTAAAVGTAAIYTGFVFAIP
jgi:hypothetical protein